MTQDALSAGCHSYQSNSSTTEQQPLLVAGYQSSNNQDPSTPSMASAPHISQPPSGSNAEGQPKLAQSPPNSTNYPPSTTGDGYGNGLSATPTSGLGSGGGATGDLKSLLPQGAPKRLHVSNIPFRFREAELRQLFYVSVCVMWYILI